MAKRKCIKFFLIFSIRVFHFIIYSFITQTKNMLIIKLMFLFNITLVSVYIFLVQLYRKSLQTNKLSTYNTHGKFSLKRTKKTCFLHDKVIIIIKKIYKYTYYKQQQKDMYLNLYVFFCLCFNMILCSSFFMNFFLSYFLSFLRF